MPKKIQDVSKKILDAATQIYQHEGYEKISIRRIATLSGLAIGTVYTRFEDKEEVVALVLAAEIEGIKDLVIASVFNKTPDEAFKAAIHTFFDKVNASSRDAFEHVLHIEGHKDYIQKALSGASSQIKEVLKEIIIQLYEKHRTNITEKCAEIIAEVAFGMVHMLSKQKEYTIEEKTDFVYEFVIAYGKNNAKGALGNE